MPAPVRLSIAEFAKLFEVYRATVDTRIRTGSFPHRVEWPNGGPAVVVVPARIVRARRRRLRAQEERRASVSRNLGSHHVTASRSDVKSVAD